MNHSKKTPLTLKEAGLFYLAKGQESALPLSSDQAVKRVLAGLPMTEFDALQEMLKMTGDQLAEALSISRSTLARRRLGGKLDPLESDRLMRFARLLARAREVLGGEAEAREWMKTPARALAFETPIRFAGTEIGAREVENLLGRLEQGVFS